MGAWGRDRARTHGKHAPAGCAGYAIVPVRPPGNAAHPAQLRYRALHGKNDLVRLLRLGRRPPAREQRGSFYGVPVRCQAPFRRTKSEPGTRR